MALQKYEGQDSIKLGSVVPATGLRAVADSWADVGRTAGKLQAKAGDDLDQQAKIRGKQEGERAVWVDPKTNIPQIVGTMPEGTSPHALEYRAAAEARYQAELGLSSMTKIAELSNANMGNPEGFRNAWAGYTQGITDNVQETIKPGTELLLKKLGTEQYAKMQMDDFNVTREQAKVTAVNTLDAFSKNVVDTLRRTGVAAGTDSYMQSSLSVVEGLLNDQVKARTMTPDEANKTMEFERFKLVRGMISGETIKMAKEGKAAQIPAFLDEFQRGDNKMVDDYQRQQISAFAEREVSNEMTRVKAAAAQQLATTKQTVKDASETWMKGETYAIDDAKVFQMAQDTGDPQVLKDAQTAYVNGTMISQFNTLPPQEQGDQLQQMGKGAQTSDSLKTREAMEASYRSTLSAIQSRDTLELASKRGIVAMDPIDWATPATWQKRRSDVGIADQHFGVASNPLTPTEREQLESQLQGMDSNGKMQLYSQMQANMGDDIAERAITQIGDKRPADWIALSISNEAPDVSRQIMLGDHALQASSGKVLPDTTNLFTDFNSYVGTAVVDDPKLSNGIYAAARAYHAANVARGVDADFSDAIDAVTGGIANINGFKTIVPKRGMTSDQMNHMVDTMSEADLASITGGKKVVTMDGTEVPIDTIRDKAVLEWAGDGRYGLSLNVAGSPMAVFFLESDGKLSGAQIDLKPIIGK